jgi:hypothetical protein
VTGRHSVFLKQALLAFWSVWLTLVCLTNVLDGARALGLLDQDWAFASGNYCLLVATTARYETPMWLNGVLFVGVICWEGLAAVLFWLTLLRFRGRAGAEGTPLLYTAFTVSLLLWAGFMIADDVFIAYALEAIHIRLFVAQLMTLLAIELLPETRQPPAS